MLAEVDRRADTSEAPAGPFVLNGRADRLERHADGRLSVIDYKTGACRPKPRRSRSGRQPQLPLEAAMVRAGAFEGVARGRGRGACWFWSLRGDGRGCEERCIGDQGPGR